jgi:hypothetical protein
VPLRSLWQMTETEKSEIAQKDTSTVMEVHGAGLISDQVALRELQFSVRRTGRWKAITDEIVEAASDEVAPQGGLPSSRRHRWKILSNPTPLWMAPRTRKPPECLDCF